MPRLTPTMRLLFVAICILGILSATPRAFSQSTDRSTLGKRLPSEALTGVGGGVIGAFAGLSGGALLGLALERDGAPRRDPVFGALDGVPNQPGRTVGALYGGILGLTIGTADGVAGGGHMTGGNGSFATTLGGSLVGIATGGALFLVLHNSDSESLPARWSTLALPAAGAVVGYELSHQPRSGSAVGLQLDVGFSPSPHGRGAVFSLSGRW